MKSKISLFLSLLICFIILIGCSNKESLPASTNKDEPKAEEKKDKPIELVNTYPLSGIKTNDPVNQRAIAVMINNHPKARPQTGLHQADIVYEVLAEGFITRFLAIYQSELPDIVGPVRSAREYYIDLSKGYNSVYIAFGGSPEAFDMLKRGTVDFLNGINFNYRDEKYFYRVSSRKAPHNVYMKKSKMLDGIEARGYDQTDQIEPLPFLSKEEEKAISGEAATDVMVVYKNTSTARYEYDKETENYQRYDTGEKTVDLETKTPVMLDNIFIVEARHDVVDSVGRREIDFEAGGKGLLIQKGKYQEVEWRNVDDRILPYKDGKLVKLVPGKTWINVIPKSPGLEKAVTIEPQPTS